MDSLEKIIPKKEQICLTLGTFQSGQKWFGFDLEVRLIDHIGIQAGSGHFGFGGGFNYHLKPEIKSSLISLQYWQDGVKENFNKSVIGLSYIYRHKKIFTCQLGLGKILDSNLSQAVLEEEPNILLVYSIGLYFTR
jgi:hypothetical protein